MRASFLQFRPLVQFKSIRNILNYIEYYYNFQRYPDIQEIIIQKSVKARSVLPQNKVGQCAPLRPMSI